MTQQGLKKSTRTHDIARRQERALRILDAAEALILRWGYQKTTLDDISRQARVAKGTIYLHWKTREELFRALMKREKLELTKDLRQHTSEDTSGATLQGMLKHLTLIMLKRPLMKAVILRDIEVIGKLAHNERRSVTQIEKIAGFTIYLEFLRAHQLVRTDLSIQAQIYLISAIFTGFFFVAPVMPDEFTLTDEQMADLLAEAIHRILEPARPAPAAEMEQAAQKFMQYLDQAIEMQQEQFNQELQA
ncbi:TetR/AcrR family transcriptional regulator [Dictyobacter formicarum]|uniref:TetR family transcriptional regulator n=1 Tax=Dictyobacter formicarum TaxID=2778368 RepID=A0ABQ3VJ68_9CHLR|nr:TetR/AcrR family transcriptional regulator [Dictyobacter formicarum]GHO86255.1 TetR family transcriptional regulator [Dictyobacter formicarum]